MTSSNGDMTQPRHPHLLPSGWERAYDHASKRHFYVDHNTRTTTWLNPIATEPKSASQCCGDQLPYGWERLTDPVSGKVFYANHIERLNQWTNPVTDWRNRISNQHHYSNSDHVLRLAQSVNSFTSNNQTNSQTTSDSKPDTSLLASDSDDKWAVSLNNSNTMSTDPVDTYRSTNSRGTNKEASLLEVMGSFEKSGQSIEV